MCTAPCSSSPILQYWTLTMFSTKLGCVLHCTTQITKKKKKIVNPFPHLLVPQLTVKFALEISAVENTLL